MEFQHPISLARPLHRACLGGSLEVVKYLGTVFLWCCDFLLTCVRVCVCVCSGGEKGCS